MVFQKFSPTCSVLTPFIGAKKMRFVLSRWWLGFVFIFCMRHPASVCGEFLVAYVTFISISNTSSYQFTLFLVISESVVIGWSNVFATERTGPSLCHLLVDCQRVGSQVGVIIPTLITDASSVLVPYYFTCCISRKLIHWIDSIYYCPAFPLNLRIQLG